MRKPLPLLVLLSACTTAKICGTPPDDGVLTPLIYHLQPDEPWLTGHQFSNAAVSAWNGHADAETCALPNATIDDPILGIHLEGAIFLEGTSPVANGVTPYAEPVFVGAGSFYVPELETFRAEEQVTALLR